MEKKYIGVKELAEYLDVDVKTIYDWVWKKSIPYYKIGRLVKFSLPQIDAFLKERYVAPLK